ncbi:AB-hydrolase associated lipase region and Alpha beta hydrolase fold-1 domain containing protein [Aphelenchoides besseyi]|nr:AB-hydrolase associated lipase region and Alpha beta hydrolase fold-1 domain containing protein [Aphelenchoides besseyi]KAI6194793.1 AB-hydrolase associated lipase region and Alpha beta hydrolase fold-1 domain containing protein [Aphelenchoides besseyi]
MLLPIFCFLFCASVGSVPTKQKHLDDYTTLELIEYRGYVGEEHNVITEDRYILTLHRIPYGRSGHPSANRPVVFMQHGLEDSSASFVINYPGNSAGYLFADAGFDVWLANSRGNNYSRDHTRFDPQSAQFWNFTFDEMAKYDLSASIDFVLKETQQSSLYYGTLIMFAKLAEDPDFGKKIRAYFALGPCATVNHITGGMRIIADLGLIDWYLWFFGDGQFISYGTIIEKTLEREICRLFGGKFCDVLIMTLFGTDSNQLNSDLVPVYLGHFPAGTSNRNVQHWTQMVKSGRFCRYDWRNGRKPEAYDLSKIRHVPIYLYASSTDWLADTSDVTYLRNHLPQELVIQNNQLSDYNHMDFLWGDRAANEVFIPIIQTIKTLMLDE